MNIEIKAGFANIYTPYNANFVKKIKAIGDAKWNAGEKCWTVPVSCMDMVREMMKDVYGYSDISENETVTLKVTFNKSASETCKDVMLFNKVVAHACGRDSGAKVGTDVVFLVGMPESGGSRNHWCSYVGQGCVVTLSNVNKNVYEHAEIPYDVTIEVLEKHDSDRQELLKEKERLLKRLEEIEKLLKE